MGATSARKAISILANTEHAIAIELLAAAQGLDLRAPLSPAPGTGAALGAIRSISPTLEEDRPLADEITALRRAMADGIIAEALAAAVGRVT